MNISEMSWGLKLWFDLWAVGIASSSFIVAFIINRMSGGKQEKLFRLAVYSGIVFALIGVVLLLTHLGHLLWFWHMFVIVRPLSVLSLGGWILSLWLTVCGVTAVLWIAKFIFKGLAGLADKVTTVLSWIGFGLSFLLVSYGGVLIATTNQPLWADTLLLPSVFLGSALCTGLGWLILASFIANWATGVKALGGLLKLLFGASDWKIDADIVHKLARTLVVTLAVTLVIVAAFIGWLYAVAPDAVGVLTTGELALYFWLGVVGFGLLLPFVMLLAVWKRGVEAASLKAMVAGSAFIALAGGLILRAVILIGAQL